MRKVQEQGKPKKKDGVLEKLLYFDKLFLRAKKHHTVHTFPWCGSPVPIFAYSFRIHHTAVTHSGAPSGLRTVSVKSPSLRSQRMNRSPYGVGTDPSAKDSPSGGQG